MSMLVPHPSWFFGLESLVLTSCLFACSAGALPPVGEPQSDVGPATTTAASEATPPAPGAPQTTTAASAAPASAATTAARHRSAAAAPLLRLAKVTQVVSAPIHSLALEPERGKVAALGTAPWLFDGETWKEIAIPAKLEPAAGERDRARIHFGRDYLPRIMGDRRGSGEPRQLYLRYRHGAWRDEQREQASFAGKPHAALYGVLGYDDPEVMCKVGEFCLIKQRSGWSKVPLPIEPPETALRIDLGTGGAYALLERRLLRLGRSRWQPVGDVGPWQGTPGGAWIHPKGGWVSAPAEKAIYEHHGGEWKRHPSPVAEPRGLWAGKATELWVAGSDGVGYYDGKNWYRVAEMKGPFIEVIGLKGRLWFAGSSGVWSAQREP